MALSIALPSAMAPASEKMVSLEGDIIAITIIVFVNDNRTDLAVNLESITFNTTDEWVNQTSTQTIFSMIADAALTKALADGHIICPANCSQVSQMTRVIFPSCVQRTGSGVDTRFSSCIPNAITYRDYTVCCPNGIGTPEFINVNNESSGCQGGVMGCEPTYQ
jgi:hypothetical protein